MTQLERLIDELLYWNPQQDLREKFEEYWSKITQFIFTKFNNRYMLQSNNQKMPLHTKCYRAPFLLQINQHISTISSHH